MPNDREKNDEEDDEEKDEEDEQMKQPELVTVHDYQIMLTGLILDLYKLKIEILESQHPETRRTHEIKTLNVRSYVIQIIHETEHIVTKIDEDDEEVPQKPEQQIVLDYQVMLAGLILNSLKLKIEILELQHLIQILTHLIVLQNVHFYVIQTTHEMEQLQLV